MITLPLAVLFVVAIAFAEYRKNRKWEIKHLEDELKEMEALAELVIMANVLTSFTDRVRLMSKSLKARQVYMRVDLSEGRNTDLDKLADVIENGLNAGNWWKKYHRRLLTESSVAQLKALRRQYEHPSSRPLTTDNSIYRA